MMHALVLEDVESFQLREVPDPVPKESEVLVQVGAVGICGTDLHIFHGIANYHRDERGQPIPLRAHPQILGHEFCGRVAAVGGMVTKVRPGDRVVVDQVLTCRGQGRVPVCEYCQTADSHQCEFGQELGVTGPPGAFRDYVTVPETNLVALSREMPFARAALIEPLGCVVHACERVDQAQTRYTFEGKARIRYVLIAGAGPSGLLFLQHLRNVKRFDGEIFIADMKETRLNLARRLGGTPLDVRTVDMVSEILRRTNGERVHYLIEASGSGAVFDWLPWVIRRQATVLVYGGGHAGRDIGCLTALQVIENTLVTTAGASGGFDPDGTPTTYRLAMEYIRDGKIDADSLLTHRYAGLDQIPHAFTADAGLESFIKGVLVRAEAS
jgi:L-iditol 2-dehydrogenase